MRPLGLSARERVFAGLCLLAFALALAALALTRTWLAYGTETDFLGGFVPEAERILAGRPLLLEWHPPLYPFVLALVQNMTGDWVASGLAISYVAGLITVACSFWLLRELAGAAAGWGAVLGLAGSAPFVQYAVSATSDLLFLALFLASYLLVALALRTQSAPHWLAAGLLIGVAVLTRSNALSLVLLAGAPFLCKAPLERKMRHLALLLAGLALPLVLWGLYAGATGSPLAPRNTHVNLALTYFAEGPDRISSYGRLRVEGRFADVLDVLAHDPSLIATTYIIDLVNLVRRGLPALLEAPFHLLFLPGLVFLIVRRWSTIFAFFLAISLAQVLLVNMKAFETRYYMFLVPLFGAGVIEIFARLLTATPPGRARMAIRALVVLGSISAFGLATTLAQRLVSDANAELAEAVPRAQAIMGGSSLVITRKPHLAFYTGATRVRFPDVSTLSALHDHARSVAGRQPLYLFYGQQERSSVPELSGLALPATAPDWLRPVARSDRPGAWVLYRYARADRGSEGKRGDSHGL